jgi:hypothetical protein
MAENVWKNESGTLGSKPGSGGSIALNYPVLGIVKDNNDPTHSGKIQVYISSLGSLDPDNYESWIPVNYMSSYFGMVRPTASDDGWGNYKTAPSSYGMWNSPPDIGTTVIVIFVDGEINKGFIIGSVPEPALLGQVPTIAATDFVVMNQGEAEILAGTLRLPTTNINTNNTSINDPSAFLDMPKPVHSYVSWVMHQQGIIRDPIRGPISSSALRETPSRVGWGVCTPGRPIYEGGYDDATVADALSNQPSTQGDGVVSGNSSDLRVVSRRGGHSIVMDDGDVLGRDQLVRIRTALGHQIMLSDSGQCISILHSNGQSYIELGKEGTIDMFATNSINLRSQGDINLHADRAIHIQANKDLNMQSFGSMFSGVAKNFEHSVGGKYECSVGTIYSINAGGAMSLQSTVSATLAAVGAVFCKGAFLFLNSLLAPVLPANVKGPDIYKHPDTFWDPQKGFLAASEALASICTRVPAHYPWAAAGQGIDVNIKLAPDGTGSSSPTVPDPVSSAVAAVNKAAAAATAKPPGG